MSFWNDNIYHFLFYLKIKKVYIELIDDPLNQLLKLYKKTRVSFIIKMFILWIIGFFVLSIELIILFFTFRMQWKKALPIKFDKKN